LMTAVIKTA